MSHCNSTSTSTSTTRKPSSELFGPALKRSASASLRSAFGLAATVKRVPSVSAVQPLSVRKRSSRSSLGRIRTNLIRTFSSSNSSPQVAAGSASFMPDFQIVSQVPADTHDYYSSSDDSFNSNFDDTFRYGDDDDDEAHDADGYDTSYSSNNTSPDIYNVSQFQFHQFNPKLNFFADHDASFDTLTQPSQGAPTLRPAAHDIFQIPEILDLIIRYVNDESDIPQEPVMIKRSPSSLNHAVLQYGHKAGPKLWHHHQQQQQQQQHPRNTPSSTMFNCLLVNKLWNSVTIQILNEYIHLRSSNQLEKLTSMLLTQSTQRQLTSSKTYNDKLLPKSIIMHKVQTHQSILDCFTSQIDGLNLSWLEFYICPNVKPSPQIITEKLTKLILPGCSLLNDDDLICMLKRAPNLTQLDLRACNLITDKSIYEIGNYTPRLEMLNLGRHTNGELITDLSMGNVIKNCTQLTTIGLAGCGVSDWTIWEIAIKLGPSLQRLSINYCWKLTDMGICKSIKAQLFQNLSVLEIKDLNLGPGLVEVCLWKKACLNNGQKVILEACENLDQKMIIINQKLSS